MARFYRRSEKIKKLFKFSHFPSGHISDISICIHAKTSREVRIRDSMNDKKMQIAKSSFVQQIAIQRKLVFYIQRVELSSDPSSVANPSMSIGVQNVTSDEN